MLRQLHNKFKRLFTMNRVIPKDPLIFILGATGTGKSQVSLPTRK